MGVFRVLRAAEIAQRITDYIVTRAPALTDVEPGSNLAQIVGAVARQAEQWHISTAQLLELFSINRARGADLDARAADYLPADIRRGAGTRALGSLRWTRAVATASAVVIPAGTLVSRPGSDPSVVYVTTAPGEIPALGTQSVRTDGPPGDIPARARDVGAQGNAALDTVTLDLGPIPGADAVANPLPFTGGADVESDDAFRSRIVDRVASLARCTPPAIESRVREADVDGQRAVLARVLQTPWQVAYATVYVDDGAGTAESFASTAAVETLTFAGGATGGEVRFYTQSWPLRQDAWTLTLTPAVGPVVVLAQGVDYEVIPSQGLFVLSPTLFPTGLAAGDVLTIAPYEYYTGLLAECQRLIDGDVSDPVNYPVWRAAGVELRVRPPRVRWVVVSCTIVVADGFNRDTTRERVRRAISGYIAGLGIGDDVILSELIERAMGVDGMFDVQFTTPAANIPTADDEIARIDSSNLTVN